MFLKYWVVVFIISSSALAHSFSCVGFYSNIKGSNQILSIGEGSKTIRKTPDALSSENLLRLRQDLGVLTAQEQILFDKILKLPTLVTHRTSLDTLVEVLNDGGLYSKKELFSNLESAKQFQATQANDQMNTPRAEDILYDASDFVFATVSATGWRGDERYGSVSLIVRNSHWQQNGWGSEHSGWFYIKLATAQLGLELSYTDPKQEIIDRSAEFFKNEVYVPKDFNLLTATRTIEYLRKNQNFSLGELVKLTDQGLTAWLNKQHLGYLEGKFKHILTGDIERIEISKFDYPRLQQVLESLPHSLAIPIDIID